MQTTAREIMSYPYWPSDRTQDPANIRGVFVRNELQDLGINREPLRTDYDPLYINVSITRPNLPQDMSQMGTLADHPTYGVSQPGGLYADLMGSVPSLGDTTPTGKGSRAEATPTGKGSGGLYYGS